MPELSMPLNPAQLDILKVLSRPLDEEDLISIKKGLLHYSANKLTVKADEIYSVEKEQELLNGHYKTPYKLK
jgi:F0F1-type ATP synthase epsilon subunit